MGGIIFQIVVMLSLVGLLIYVVRDDRRNRDLRALEDAEELRQSRSQPQKQAQPPSGQGPSD